MESPMMATSPLFSTTLTTSQPCQTYIGLLSEFIPTPLPPENHYSYHYCQPAPCAIYHSTPRVLGQLRTT